MSTRFRNYTGEPGFTDDFHWVRDFLVRINRKNPILYDFEWGRWEWAFSLSFLDTENLSKIGVWESDGQIVALATYEERPGSIYFCIDPAFHFLKAEMLLYARENLCSSDGKLKILINNVDEELQLIAAKQGFVATQDLEGNAVYDIDLDAISYALPDGYSLISLADGFDIVKFDRVLWRGFNHEGDPPATEADLADRRTSISGPHLNLDLCILIVAPNGDYASYCGMWYDNETEYALVEPVATDPDHRLLGLGRAAVLEGIRRCGQLGAKQAYVGSSQQFYYQIGFRPVPTSTFWAG
jgi:GNAT superfamily N-acetyltransferase